MHRGIALLFLISLIPQAFAQIQVYDSRPGGAPAAVVDEAPADDDPAAEAAEELSAQRESMADKVGAITGEEDPEQSEDENKPALTVSQDLLDIQAELQKGRSALDLIKDDKLRAKLIRAYEKNPMQEMPREMLKNVLDAQLNANSAGKMIKGLPKMLDFMVDFMRHPTAIASALKMFNRMDDLRTCGIISVCLFAIVVFLRTRVVREEMPFVKKMILKLGFSLGFIAGSFGTFYLNFSEEIGPALEVLRKTYF